MLKIYTSTTYLWLYNFKCILDFFINLLDLKSKCWFHWASQNLYFSRILADLYFDYRECLIHNRRQFNFPDRTQFVKRLRSERSSSSKGPSRWITPKEGAIHKWRYPLRGEGGSAKRECYFVSIFSKMGDKGEGRVKNLRKMGDVIYGRSRTSMTNY